MNLSTFIAGFSFFSRPIALIATWLKHSHTLLYELDIIFHAFLPYHMYTGKRCLNIIGPVAQILQKTSFETDIYLPNYPHISRMNHSNSAHNLGVFQHDFIHEHFLLISKGFLLQLLLKSYARWVLPSLPPTRWHPINLGM